MIFNHFQIPRYCEALILIHLTSRKEENSNK